MKDPPIVAESTVLRQTALSAAVICLRLPGQLHSLVVSACRFVMVSGDSMHGI